MAWKQVNSGGDFYAWKNKSPGDGIEGIWKGTTPNQFKNPKTGLPNVDGNVELVDGTPLRFEFPTVLANRFAGDAERGEEPIEVGTMVKIVYKGKVSPKGGGAPYHSFDIFVDDSAAPPS